MDVKKIIDEISKLEGDEREAAIDAFQRILMGRLGGGGGKGLPPGVKMPVDPELKQPDDEIPPSPPTDPDTKVENPDNIHPKSKDDEKSEDDKDDKEDKKDKDNDGDKKDKDNDDDSDVDDEDGKEGPQTADDAERKKNDDRSKKSALRDLKKLTSKAEKKADTEEKKQAVEEAQKALQELEENSDAMSMDKFSEKANEILDKLDEVLDINYIDNNKERKDAIHKSMDDPLENDDINDEDQTNMESDPTYKKLQAREKEKERYRREQEKADAEGKSTAVRPMDGNLAAFKKDLEKAIGDQIDNWKEIEDLSYAIVDRHHEEDDIAAPGTRIDDIRDEDMPSVDIYFDQSGSWGTWEVEKGMEAIRDILELEDEGLLKINIKYFSNILTADQSAARDQGSTECWGYVIDDILAEPKAKNVIIMTDTDIAHDYRFAGHNGCVADPRTVVVEGCVWYIWKNGVEVPQAYKKLRGKEGTFKYFFS